MKVRDKLGECRNCLKCVLNKDMYNDPVNGRYFELNSEEIQQLYNS